MPLVRFSAFVPNQLDWYGGPIRPRRQYPEPEIFTGDFQHASGYQAKQVRLAGHHEYLEDFRNFQCAIELQSRPFLYSRHCILSLDPRPQDHERSDPEILDRPYLPQRRVPMPGNGQNRVLKQRNFVESAICWNDPIDCRVHPPFAQPAIELDWTRPGAECHRDPRRGTGQSFLKSHGNHWPEWVRNADHELSFRCPRVEGPSFTHGLTDRTERTAQPRVDHVGYGGRHDASRLADEESSLNAPRSRVMAWLTAGWVIASRSAALDRLPCSYTASNTGSRLRSTLLRLSMVHIIYSKYSVVCVSTRI